MLSRRIHFRPAQGRCGDPRTEGVCIIAYRHLITTELFRGFQRPFATRAILVRTSEIPTAKTPPRSGRAADTMNRKVILRQCSYPYDSPSGQVGKWT